jgi:hypothetical protein
VTFHLTQLLSGHGCFEAYLHRIGKADDPRCVNCNSGEIDSAEHTLVKCARFEEAREQMTRALQNRRDRIVSAEMIVQGMLESEEKWEAVSTFATKVMGAKELGERERERQRRVANGEG